jgi:putative membrane protein
MESIVIRKAVFNPLVKTYLLLYVFGILLISIIGIPLALIWICGVGQWWCRHFYEKLECVLSEKHLRLRMGILVQVDKTIPLENIQDMTFYEGPILRKFNLSMLKVETAGQGAGKGNEMSLIGIEQAHDFRLLVLDQREKIRLAMQQHGDDATKVLLTDIREILLRIEGGLKK